MTNNIKEVGVRAKEALMQNEAIKALLNNGFDKSTVILHPEYRELYYAELLKQLVSAGLELYLQDNKDHKWTLESDHSFDIFLSAAFVKQLEDITDMPVNRIEDFEPIVEEFTQRRGILEAILTKSRFYRYLNEMEIWFARIVEFR